MERPASSKGNAVPRLLEGAQQAKSGADQICRATKRKVPPRRYRESAGSSDRIRNSAHDKSAWLQWKLYLERCSAAASQHVLKNTHARILVATRRHSVEQVSYKVWSYPCTLSQRWQRSRRCGVLYHTRRHGPQPSHPTPNGHRDV